MAEWTHGNKRSSKEEGFKLGETDKEPRFLFRIEEPDQTGVESVGMLRGEARVGVTSDTLRREEMRGSRGVIVVAITVV